jgi:DNA polymerase delta subunit 2
LHFLIPQHSVDDLTADEVPERTVSNYVPLHSFVLEKNRQYQQQFADMYFLRLTKIKPAVDEVAAAAWDDIVIGGEKARPADRVLDVRQGELCWVSGTVYMDMPLKPDILEDVSKDVSLPPFSILSFFSFLLHLLPLLYTRWARGGNSTDHQQRWISAPTSIEKYYAGDDRDAVMLEDDSGRIRLVGEVLQRYVLVTGCIIAVMGTENADGEFEVIDLRMPDLAPQPERWALKGSIGEKKGKKIKDEDTEMTEGGSGKKIAIVSGLEFSSTDNSYAMEISLLLEYLLGEALDPAAQGELAHISRLIIAGNSVAKPVVADADDQSSNKKTQKKYGYDASSYNAVPSQLFDKFLADLLPSMPVTLLPGANDPANSSFPQQPIHTAMFPFARTYIPLPSTDDKPAEPGWLDTVTNPWEAEVEGWRVLGTAGQNLDDLSKYVEGTDRLALMESMCRWRCTAPTAPDTLCKYLFSDDIPRLQPMLRFKRDLSLCFKNTC